MKPIGLFVSALLASASLSLSSPIQQVRPSSPPVAPVEFVYIDIGENTSGLFHQKDCPWVKNTTIRGFSPDEAKKRYFQPHCLCITGKEDVPPCESAQGSAVPPSAPLSAVTAPAPPPVRTAMPAPITTKPPSIQNTARPQCAATTKKGTRCSRMAQPGRAYCYQHP